MTATDWTNLIMNFFSEQSIKNNTVNEGEYMLVDQVWRGQQGEIVFALEHEHIGSDVEELLDKEVEHLIDLRARAKVGIFYPNLGDEKTLVENISSRILHRSLNVDIPGEQYLFILGFATKKQSKPAILFKAYFFDHNGRRTGYQEHVVLQGPKSQVS